MLRTFHTWVESVLRERRRYRRRYPLFAEAAAREGRRLETLPPDELAALDATEIVTTVDGIPCRLNLEVRTLPGGALYVCIDAHGLGRWRKQPGYHFTRHPDGSIDYDGRT